MIFGFPFQVTSGHSGGHLVYASVIMVFRIAGALGP